MPDSRSFFSSAQQEASQQIHHLSRQLRIFGALRLLVFLMAVLVWFLHADFFIQLGISILSIVVFFWMIVRYNSIRENRIKYQKQLSLSKNELRAHDGDYSMFYDGKKYLDSKHAYALDLDIFGTQCVFQAINRTHASFGEKILADKLLCNEVNNVAENQQIIQELATDPAWLLKFRTLISLAEKADSEEIKNKLHDFKPLIRAGFKYVPTIFSIISVVHLALCAFFILPWNSIWITFVAGLVISAQFLKRGNIINKNTTSISNAIGPISELIQLISETDRTESHLQKNKKLADETWVEIKKLSRILQGFDQRNNILVAIVMNGFFLRDLHYSLAAQNWLSAHANKIVLAIDIISQTDCFVSCSNFAFTHAEYTYPSISHQHETLVCSKQIAHPLMNKQNLVRNDFEINKASFFIVTGANMAGKSTFLRTAGTSIVLANCGLPVNAREFIYSPVKVFSSMRTADSLVNDESYFFAELKRLKFIIDQMLAEPCFIILDEILKGTNSKDKEEGSAKILARLAKSGSAGLLATHDLTVCELEKEYHTIHNYCFNAYIEHDNLRFDYLLKKGIAEGKNATFLLKKMGITEA